MKVNVLIIFFISTLQVKYYHLYQHKTANASPFCFIKTSSFSQKSFEYEIKRSELRILGLSMHRDDDTFVAFRPIKYNISWQTSDFIFDFNNRYFTYNINYLLKAIYQS
jgi:hypothetical protein